MNTFYVKVKNGQIIVTNKSISFHSCKTKSAGKVFANILNYRINRGLGL